MSLLFIDSIGNSAKKLSVFEPGNHPDFGCREQADKISSRAKFDAVWIQWRVFCGLLRTSRHEYWVRIVVPEKSFQKMWRDMLLLFFSGDCLAEYKIQEVCNIFMRESTELTSSAREKSLMTSESLPDLLFPSQQRWGGLRCPGVSLQWDICEWDARACKNGVPTMSGAVAGDYEVYQRSQHHPWWVSYPFNPSRLQRWSVQASSGDDGDWSDDFSVEISKKSRKS